MQEGRHEVRRLGFLESERGPSGGLAAEVQLQSSASRQYAESSISRPLDPTVASVSEIKVIDNHLDSMAVRPGFDRIYDVLVLFENTLRGYDSISIGTDAALWLSWFEKQRVQDKVDEKLTIIITFLNWIQQVQQAQVSGVIIDTTKFSLGERATWHQLPEKYITVLFSLSSYFDLRNIGTQICYSMVERWLAEVPCKDRVQLVSLREISRLFDGFFQRIDRFFLGSVSDGVRHWFERTSATLVMTKEILTDLLSTIIEASLTQNQQIIFDIILHSIFTLSLDNVKKSDLTLAQKRSDLALIGLIFCSFNACLSLSQQGGVNYYADYFNSFFESVHALLGKSAFNAGGGLSIEPSGKAYRGLKLRDKIIFLTDLFAIFIQSPQKRGLPKVVLLSFDIDSNLTMLQLLLSVIDFVKEPKNGIDKSPEFDQLEPLLYRFLKQLVSERDDALLPDLLSLLWSNNFEWGKFFNAVKAKSNEVTPESWDASLLSRLVHCQFNPYTEEGTEDYRQSLLTHLLSSSRFDVVNLLLELSLPDQLFFPNHVFLQDAPWAVEFKALEKNILDSCKALLGREVPLLTVSKCIETLAGKVNKWKNINQIKNKKNQGLELLFAQSLSSTASSSNADKSPHAADPFINLCENLVRELIHVTPTSSFHLMKPLMLALLSVIPDKTQSATTRWEAIINNQKQKEEDDIDRWVKAVNGSSSSSKKSRRKKKLTSKSLTKSKPEEESRGKIKKRKNKRRAIGDTKKADSTYTGLAQKPSPKVFHQDNDHGYDQELKATSDEDRLQIIKPDDVLAYLARIDPDMRLQQSLGCPLFLLAYKYADTCETQRVESKSHTRKGKSHPADVTLSSDLIQQVIDYFMESPNAEGLSNCLDMVTKEHPSFSTFLFQTLFDLHYLSERFTSLKQLMDGSLAKNQFIEICYELMSDKPSVKWLHQESTKRHVITHATHQLQDWMDCYAYLDERSRRKLNDVVTTIANEWFVMLVPFKELIPQMDLSLEDKTLLETFLDANYLKRRDCFDLLLDYGSLSTIKAQLDETLRTKNGSMTGSGFFATKSVSTAEPGLTRTKGVQAMRH